MRMFRFKLPSRPIDRSAVRKADLFLRPLEDRCVPAVLVVNTLGDPTASTSGELSLREAVSQANNTPGQDTITFAQSLFSAGSATIDINSELPAVTGDLTLIGPGSGTLTIARGGDAAADFRILEFGSGVTGSITGVTFTGGDTSSGNGGAILNAGNLTLTGDVFQGNSAYDSGGAIFDSGNMTLEDCTFSANAADTGAPQGFGGAIAHNTGTLSISDSTFTGNTSFASGALDLNSGTVEITNSTFAGNSSTYRSGAITNYQANLTITGSTITGNHGGSNAGGLDLWDFTGSSTAIYDTIVAGNLVGPYAGTSLDIDAAVAPTSSNNLIGDSGSAGGLTSGYNGNVVGVAGKGTQSISLVLDTGLKSNGGPTQTVALAAGSPAIGAGSTTVPGYSSLDQRGDPRDPTHPDIGAVEGSVGDLTPVPPPTTPPTSTPTYTDPLVPTGVPTNFATLFGSPSADANTAYVKGLYESILNRSADTVGLSFWVNQLNQGESRYQVAYSFVDSQENRQKEVTAFYEDLLGRAPDPAGLAADTLALQAGINEAMVVADIASSAEFIGTKSIPQYVDALYTALLGRTADAGGAATWVAALNAGTLTPQQVAIEFAISGEEASTVATAEYSAFLERTPSPGEVQGSIAPLVSNRVTFGQFQAHLLSSQEFYGDAVANQLGNS